MLCSGLCSLRGRGPGVVWSDCLLCFRNLSPRIVRAEDDLLSTPVPSELADKLITQGAIHPQKWPLEMTASWAHLFKS
jgi:hypothetical protein